jgi:hypothetical protein
MRASTECLYYRFALTLIDAMDKNSAAFAHNGASDCCANTGSSSGDNDGFIF